MNINEELDNLVIAEYKMIRDNKNIKHTHKELFELIKKHKIDTENYFEGIGRLKWILITLLLDAYYQEYGAYKMDENGLLKKNENSEIGLQLEERESGICEELKFILNNNFNDFLPMIEELYGKDYKFMNLLELINDDAMMIPMTMCGYQERIRSIIDDSDRYATYIDLSEIRMPSNIEITKEHIDNVSNVSFELIRHMVRFGLTKRECLFKEVDVDRLAAYHNSKKK